jgi:hypothetical protein
VKKLLPLLIHCWPSILFGVDIEQMLKNDNPSSHEIQRLRVQSQCLYGIWTGFEGAIELKILPCVGGVKIKLWSVNDLLAIEKISLFCGIKLKPRRINWHGFDLISKLEKKGSGSFVNGIVNMPNSKRRNLADFEIVDEGLAKLIFFCGESLQDSEAQNKSLYTLLLQKKAES